MPAIIPCQQHTRDIISHQSNHTGLARYCGSLQRYLTSPLCFSQLSSRFTPSMIDQGPFHILSTQKSTTLALGPRAGGQWQRRRKKKKIVREKKFSRPRPRRGQGYVHRLVLLKQPRPSIPVASAFPVTCKIPLADFTM